jgi:hypothetical protein
MDRTFRYASDVQRRLQLPVLDVVPEYPTEKRTSKPEQQTERQPLARPVQSQSGV